MVTFGGGLYEFDQIVLLESWSLHANVRWYLHMLLVNALAELELTHRQVSQTIQLTPIGKAVWSKARVHTTTRDSSCLTS